jgi:predicted nuclease with TOPRIM domain
LNGRIKTLEEKIKKMEEAAAQGEEEIKLMHNKDNDLAKKLSNLTTTMDQVLDEFREIRKVNKKPEETKMDQEDAPERGKSQRGRKPKIQDSKTDIDIE